ncbi:hypothetical protein D9M71_750260 [compost metagenome]
MLRDQTHLREEVSSIRDAQTMDGVMHFPRRRLAGVSAEMSLNVLACNQVMSVFTHSEPIPVRTVGQKTTQYLLKFHPGDVLQQSTAIFVD